MHQAEGQVETSSGLKLHKSPTGSTAKARTLRGQILRFGAVGVVGFVVNAGMVEWLAHSIGPVWAQVLAFPVAASVTWWLNRRYTFGASSLAWRREWVCYVVANALGWSANNGVYFFLIAQSYIFYRHPALAVAVGSLAGMIFNFTISKLMVFNK